MENLHASKYFLLELHDSYTVQTSPLSVKYNLDVEIGTLVN